MHLYHISLTFFLLLLRVEWYEKGDDPDRKGTSLKTRGQGQWGRNCLWEQGVDRAGESNRKMGTTITEQQ